MRIIAALRRHGPVGFIRRAIPYAKSQVAVRYHRQRLQNEPAYESPTEEEFARIEEHLLEIGVQVNDYAPKIEGFTEFKRANWFPPTYHGGLDGGVWDEKLLEHWISYERLELESFRPTDIYVDIAAASSPWARELRNRHQFEAFANDLGPVGHDFSHLPYYRSEDATSSAFSSGSVRGASLHCAYEMFIGHSDTNLIDELARILKPGGRALIVPLYMHTHYCAYSTPEFYGKGYSDIDAKEYVRFDASNIPSSRKYDPESLKNRVLHRIEECGMDYRLLALRNKADLGKNVYCHFILEINK